MGIQSTSFIKNAIEGSRPIQLTFADVVDSDILSTASFYYDPPGSALKSTQQLNVDWSRFENHTFFNSAEAKVNVGFDQMINGYPFDGTRAEVEQFLGKLTGYERWLFDRFPRYRGALHMSGTQVGEDHDGTKGTFIVVQDIAGASFPDIARKRTGEGVLDPGTSSFSIELQLYVPEIANDVQVVCQKTSSDTQSGFVLYLTSSATTSAVEARFTVLSGSAAVTAAGTLTKGRYNHVCAVFDRTNTIPVARMYIDAALAQESSSVWELGQILSPGSSFTVGTGSAFNVKGSQVLPRQTLSGTLDELRVFHAVRTPAQQSQYAAKSVFTTPDMRLYFRFNEPPPPLSTNSTDAVNSIVLDSSGNSLHSYVTGFTGSLRIDAASDPFNPMTYERAEFAPVLFPAHSGVMGLNSEQLTSASLYDIANPNLITRLIPPHYLLEGQVNDGLDTERGQMDEPYGGSSIPGTGKLGGTQYILSFLYVWARFFDEMKMFVDAFSTLRTVGYDPIDTVPDSFLESMVRQQGFDLPPLFSDATVEQYLNAENIERDISTNALPLRTVRNQLLRRVMVALPDVIRSKGTQHSIKAFLRAVGIDPDNSMRIREYGGPTVRQLAHARESKRSMMTMVPFGTSSYLTSDPLSGSRLEVGFPQPRGTMVQKSMQPPHGISDNKNDGLLTSGSWTVETAVQWTTAQINSMTYATQGLTRIIANGTDVPVLSGGALLASLIAVSGSGDQFVKLFVRPGVDFNSPTLVMSVPAPVFDRNRWHVSFGCRRNDEIGSIVSSSYFLRAARSDGGKVTDLWVTSSFFNELSGSEKNAFRELSIPPGPNETGPMLQVGAGAPIGAITPFAFLNDTVAIGTNEPIITNFDGQMSDLRFWSRALELDEWREHVRNPKSLGVEDPLVNYNFGRTRSGSFGRLRVDTLGARSTTPTALGAVTFYDMSLNGRHMSGSGFEPGMQPTVPTQVDHSTISPYFDEAATDEKVRIRGLQVLDDETPLAIQAPVYEMPRGEEPADDTRFALEFSLVDALNRDIVNMFSTLDAFDDALGNPELAFSEDYPDLARMRDLYFNRLTGRLDFKAFFEFFRWFDGSIGTFIAQLVPRKTRFKGTNFVIESHMLERAKVTYRTADSHLEESQRVRIGSSIVHANIDASIGKF